MPFFQCCSKAIVPTPDPPPVRWLPDRGAIKASVLVVPPDGLVGKTGMKCITEMILRQYRIFGVVQVAECNSDIIIADIVCVPTKYARGQVQPETWYLPSRHTWQYPVINQIMLA
ncbi:uncharacterized protein LACBIDRAFT_325790 [Laccaria bicolor S238N-H82]|uniref:Predicted protein n=1 Tax=Laccaria bicolor (strain S238N-H82 / ATCC MYA-4686) TaxID=486041 RepID=B0D682_LACBS|nr:uncharacterized protein LACBIDRAFT_325790 [Laccaria bicolor S238N-H82]EDR10155.1 predicted protein [Laccaria bicolor S238N-H82]|eukprot:XP_001879540.1 predicted protein [Laccaria bicolor S238N-H82]